MTLHEALRWTHIGFGMVGLVVFWLPVALRKGGRMHIRTGWVFAVCAYVVAISALISSGWALVDPQGFVGRAPADADELGGLTRKVRFFFGILATLSVLLLSSVETGLGVLRTRREPERLDSPRRRGVYTLEAFCSLSLLAGGIWQLAAGNGARFLIWVGLGALVLADAVDAWRHLKRPPPTPMTWWYRHMGGMLGAGIAFHTAFVVFGAGRLLDFRPAGSLALIPWVLPSLVGVPAIQLWGRYYRRKFGEVAERP